MPATYDLIVYGATGFTGQLCCEYLKTAGKDIRWAIAGRSKSKLESVKADLGLSVDVVVADSGEYGAVLRMVKQTRAIISLVGPYAIYGSMLYACCAASGVHLFDLTAESAWCVRMMQQHEQEAVKSKAIMINSCGFDSVPADLTTLLAVKAFQKKYPQSAVGLCQGAYVVKGGFSGGTIASGMAMASEPSHIRKEVANNTYLLSPKAGPAKQQPLLSQALVGKADKAQGVGAFWIMAQHNRCIVHRTWGILQNSRAEDPDSFSYGDQFQYEEYLRVKSKVQAILASSVTCFVFFLLSIGPIRSLISRFLPAPGTGPSKEARESGFFKTSVTATSASDPSQQVTVVMRGRGDPGYKGTSVMIVESALCVIKDRDKLPQYADQAGPLTPATALGEVLVDRLVKTGLFEFETLP